MNLPVSHYEFFSNYGQDVGGGGGGGGGEVSVRMKQFFWETWDGEGHSSEIGPIEAL